MLARKLTFLIALCLPMLAMATSTTSTTLPPWQSPSPTTTGPATTSTTTTEGTTSTVTSSTVTTTTLPATAPVEAATTTEVATTSTTTSTEPPPPSTVATTTTLPATVSIPPEVALTVERMNAQAQFAQERVERCAIEAPQRAAEVGEMQRQAATLLSQVLQQAGVPTYALQAYSIDLPSREFRRSQ